MPNRLAQESSPYLLQHAENPVDWYPWGEEALEKARSEDKPIFLSIGYSACHWCHVMEHESFENTSIAEFLNENFVSIKVDREERPDLDQIYMQAVMALQRGQGGWPLSAFLTPECHVFFGGTYWPPVDSRGMPGFDRVIRSVLEAFEDRRDQVDEQSEKISAFLNSATAESQPNDHSIFDADKLLQIGASLERIFDFENGGFGRAPKFPHSMDLQVLMRLDYHEGSPSPRNPPKEESRWMKMVNLNLTKMSLGGIYDHLGGGFARYSVDDKWLVPHFEKMLYDNALLSEALLDAFTITGDPLFQQRAIETFNYQLDYMTDSSGAFFSTEDADSEGEEGKFYVWTPDEIVDILGEEDGHLFCNVYDVSDGGNFEGKNILNLKKPLEEFADQDHLEQGFLQKIASCRNKLLGVRDQRVRPGRDDKILVSWNAMMIQSMAKGGLILQNEKYLGAATLAAGFIDSTMKQKDGISLFHTCRHGQPKLDAYLDDYACFIQALITLFECTGSSNWLRRALELTQFVIDEFHDVEGGGFYFTGKNSEKLIARTKEFQDSSVPSGNGMMVNVLARLARLTEKDAFRELAMSTASLGHELIDRAPNAVGQLICGLDMLSFTGQEVIAFCDEGDRTDVLRIIMKNFHPRRIVCCVSTDLPEPPVSNSLLAGKTMQDGKPTVYVCEDYHCQAPLVGIGPIQEFFQK